MREYWSILYLSAAATLLLVGVIGTPYYISLFVSTTGLLPLMTFFVGVGLVAYMHKDEARTSITRFALILVGMILLCLPVLALLFPGLFSYKWNNLLFGDITLLAEGGIIALIAAMEQPYKQTSVSLPKPTITFPNPKIPIYNFPAIANSLSRQITHTLYMVTPKLNVPSINVLEVTESVSKVISHMSHSLRAALTPSHRTRTEP